MEQKTRQQMDRAAQWDLSAIFPNRALWEEKLSLAQEEVKALEALPGKLGASAQALRDVLDEIYRVTQQVELLYLYAMLRKCEDNGDPESQEMEGKAVRLYTELSERTAFLDPEILSLPEDTLATVRRDPLLAGYAHILDCIARGKSHTLDAAGERLLAMLGDVAGTPRTAFDMLESVDMKFPSIHNEKGEEVPLTHGNYGMYLESSCGEVRREAYETYFGAFRNYLNTWAALYAGSVKQDVFFARARHYGSARECALADSHISTTVYDGLIDAVHDGLPSLHRYLDLRKKALGREEIHMYDLYCPMVPQDEGRVTYDEAKEMVFRATEPLGERYRSLLTRAFAERWIDIYENAGKTTGAFSCGVYGVHPYILLNYTDTLEDAFTLAHELGHAMHSCFSSEAQDFANHDYKIFVAEVASTVNEVLLTMSLLRSETDRRRRAYLLNHFLEGFRLTVFRQTLFAEFERDSHAAYENGEALTAQTFNQIYRRLNEQYYQGVVVDALHDIEWARIPHFYNAFYVYQYATGFCSAVAIANQILESGKADEYLRFLSLGGSQDPLEELKVAGVDLTTPEPIHRAMEVFDRTVTELEELLAAGFEG